MECFESRHSQFPSHLVEQLKGILVSTSEATVSSQNQGKDKSLSFVLGLIVLGLFFLYLKKSGGVESIKEAVSVLDGKERASAE